MSLASLSAARVRHSREKLKKNARDIERYASRARARRLARASARALARTNFFRIDRRRSRRRARAVAPRARARMDAHSSRFNPRRVRAPFAIGGAIERHRRPRDATRDDARAVE